MKRIALCTVLFVSCGLLTRTAWTADQDKRPQDREGTPRGDGAGPRDGAGPGGAGGEGRPRPGSANDGAPRRPPNPLFAALDTNGDGELSAEEIANAPKVLKKLDKNGDGKLTPDELRPARPEGGTPPGNRPRGEGDRPRAEGDRPRPEGERRPDGDRPAREGPRDTGRPSREGDGQRGGGGDRPKAEGDYPRSRPAPEQ